jgi:hypothetical protein
LTYHPVVDRFPVVPALDPWSAALFVAVFVAAALLTARRAVYGVCALVISTPFAFYHDLAGTSVTLPKVALLGVLAGLTVYTGSLRLLRERPMPLLLGALAFYALATAVSAVDAAHRGPSARETFKVLEYGAVCAAAYLCYRLDPDAPVVVDTIAAVAAAVSLSALVQEFVGAPSGLYVGSAIVPRVAGVLEGPNQLAGYFEVALAALGAWAIGRRTLLVGSALFLAACADVLTFSRAGLFGLAIVAAIVLYFGRRAMLRALRPAFAGLVAGLAVVAGWAIYARTPGVLRVSLQGSAYAGGVGDRGELWRAAWRMFLAHPLLGVGAGNYQLDLPLYGVLGVRTHANSWFLQSLAEGGLLLFFATLLLVAAIVATFGRAVRGGSPWAIAALAAGVALSVHQIADYLVFYPKVGSAWWVLIGVAAAAIAHQRTLARA